MDVSRLLKGWRSYREFRGRMWTFTYRVTTICMIQGRSPRRIWALRQGPLGMKPQFLVLELVFQMLPSPRPLLCVVSLLMRSPLPVVLFLMSLKCEVGLTLASLVTFKVSHPELHVHLLFSSVSTDKPLDQIHLPGMNNLRYYKSTRRKRYNFCPLIFINLPSPPYS